MDEERVRGTAFWLHKNSFHRFYICPECALVAKDERDLGWHIERHRDVPEEEGKIAHPCPKGCGRVWRTKHERSVPRALREHLHLCEGLPPIRNGYHEKTPKFAILMIMKLARAYSGNGRHEEAEEEDREVRLPPRLRAID